MDLFDYFDRTLGPIKYKPSRDNDLLETIAKNLKDKNNG